MHDELLCNEVKIDEFDEKCYLFGMKSEDEDLFFCVILENVVNLGRKVRNRRLVTSDDLFFRDHCILRTKNALPREQFQAMTYFFVKDHRILRMKNALLGTISGDDFFFSEITAF